MTKGLFLLQSQWSSMHDNVWMQDNWPCVCWISNRWLKISHFEVVVMMRLQCGVIKDNLYLYLSLQLHPFDHIPDTSIFTWTERYYWCLSLLAEEESFLSVLNVYFFHMYIYISIYIISRELSLFLTGSAFAVERFKFKSRVELITMSL